MRSNSAGKVFLLLKTIKPHTSHRGFQIRLHCPLSSLRIALSGVHSAALKLESLSTWTHNTVHL